MKFIILSVILFSLPFRSCLKKEVVYIEPSGVEKDSATILEELRAAEEFKESNKIVSTGRVDGVSFKGKSRKITNIDMMLENGMEMLMSEGQYVEMKLTDDVQHITVAVRIFDLELLDRIPFSYTFVEGKKLIVTVFVRNNEGVNEMFGGTIRNIKGRFTLNSIDKTNKKMSGSIDGIYTNVLDLTSTCQIEHIDFTNAGYYFSKPARVNDTALFKNKESIIVQ